MRRRRLRGLQDHIADAKWASQKAVDFGCRAIHEATDKAKFLFAVPGGQTQAPFTVVLNWTAALKK
jgi:hypothetical protein